MAEGRRKKVLNNMEKYSETLNELQKTWEENSGLLRENHHRPEGIRSSQVAALVALLVEKGVFDKEEKIYIKQNQSTAGMGNELSPTTQELLLMKSDHCSGYKGCHKSIKTYNSSDPMCKECVADAQNAILAERYR